MRRRLRFGAVVVLLALPLVLSGCGEVRGTVTAKRHLPQIVSMTETCSGKSCIPITIVVPECWQVTVDSGGFVCLSEQRWDEISVGSFYDSKSS